MGQIGPTSASPRPTRVGREPLKDFANDSSSKDSMKRSTALSVQQPPVEKLLTGDQEARIIATRLGPPPKGYNNWTLRLLARKVVELEIVDSVSYETVRRTLKKTA